MARMKKSCRLDAGLLDQAREVLGTATATETATEALKQVVEGKRLARLLAEGRSAFPEWADPYREE